MSRGLCRDPLLFFLAFWQMQDVSRRSGLTGPTLRYYEDIGLIGPIDRDPSSRHRRYREEDLDSLQALACRRAMGVGIEDMRTYQANRLLGHEAAGEQRDLLMRHAERIESEIETLRTHLAYLADGPTIVETAESLCDLGLVEHDGGRR